MEGQEEMSAMQSPLIRISLAAMVVAILVLIVFSSFRQSQVTCEVCVAYRGASQCRTASGATREDAMRTARDNACTFLSSGRTESILCSNIKPVSVTCDP